LTLSDAAARLDARFAAGWRGLADEGNPLLGVFGDSFPHALGRACGFAVADAGFPLADGPPARVPAVEPLVEPFVDWRTQEFLHRLFAGEMDGFAAVVFSRDDAAAHVAFLYAREIVRQGIAKAKPVLLLFNLVHRDGAAAEAFNRGEAERVSAQLHSLGGAMPDARAIAAELDAERRRSDALDGLAGAMAAGAIDGTRAWRWRNAGRFMAPPDHAALLEAVLASAPVRPMPPALRMGLIGAPIGDEAIYTLAGRFGAVVADPHPLGQAWPVRCDGDGLDDLLAATAASALHPRAVPAAAHRNAIANACVDTGCDIVLAQLDDHDDSFGWDLPALRTELAAEGVPLVDLGFHAGRPGAEWLDAGARAIATALAGVPA
jgi:hypothetical protein